MTEVQQERSNRSIRPLWVFCAVALLLYLVVAPICLAVGRALEMTQWGPGWIAISELLIRIGSFGDPPSPLVLIWGVFFFFCPPHPRFAKQGVVLFVAIALITFVLGSQRLSTNWRIAGLERVTQSAIPLIQAIDSYYANEGVYPGKLNDLIPKYLDQIPDTGLLAYPNFEYEVATVHNEFYNYELRLFKGIRDMRWEAFVYRPDRPYPETMYWAPCELVGDWAYIHFRYGWWPDPYAVRVRRLPR